MKEQVIQKKIIDKLTNEGWYVIKLIRTNKNGIPDLIAIKENEARFIEVKKPDGTLSPMQKFRIKELEKRNINVKIWIDYETEMQVGK